MRFLPNFCSDRQIVAELWRFIRFKTGCRPPSWIFKSSKF